MEPSSLANIAGLDSLAEIGLRSGVDMRPTLLRVLTDLYIQKMRHTPDEERHYSELALRLLQGVDAQTRAVVAARLARHLSAPLSVIQYLASDLPEIAAPLRSHPLLQPSHPIGASLPHPVLTSRIGNRVAEKPDLKEGVPTDGPLVVDSATANKLNDLFFGAGAEERGLILRNIEIVAPLPAGHSGVSCDAAIGHRLEAAALARNREDFAQQLAQALRIPRAQARRIARDRLGEPMVIAAKALNIPRDLFYRVLIFVNPIIGHSVERVHALAELYDVITDATAEGMVAVWQALQSEDRAEPKHRPVAWNDEARSRVRSTPAVRRPPIATQTKERDGTS